MGQAFKRIFYLLAQDPAPTAVLPPVPEDTTNQCCDALLALADVNDNDELRNDVKGFVYWYDGQGITDAILELYKLVAGVWVKLDDLNDSTYGTFLNYGDFVNSDGEKFIGYTLQWQSVLILYGAGNYRVKRTVTKSFGGTKSYFSEQYCLKPFTPENANRTVRLEYYLNSRMGDAFFPDKKKNFIGLNWYDSYRFKGYFNFSKPKYTEEWNDYQDGARRFVKSDREDEYELKLVELPKIDDELYNGTVEKIIRNDFNQADQRFITDYNNNVTEVVVKMEVKPAGKYDPDAHAKLKNTGVKLLATYNPTYNFNKKLRN